MFIDQEFFQWIPNFYIVLVAPPGIVNKSTTIGVGERMLRAANVAQFGPNVATWQAVTLALANVAQVVPIEHGDDLLAKKMMAMSCLTFYASEFGSLIDADDKRMLMILTDLWDGKLGEWKKETKNSGSDTIANPFVNILACTTPHWMSENMGKGMIGGGFSSRCVFVYADRKARYIAYPKFIPKEVSNLPDLLVEDLIDIANMRGEMYLTPEAIAWGEAWYIRHNKIAEAKGADSDMIGYLSRKQGHIHKLAMVISASRNSDMTITKEDLEFAEQMVTSTEGSLSKVLGEVNADPNQTQARYLLAVVAAKRKVPRNVLYGMVFKRMSKRTFDEAISSCMEAGWFAQVQYGTTFHIIATEKLYSTLDVDAANLPESEDHEP